MVNISPTDPLTVAGIRTKAISHEGIMSFPKEIVRIICFVQPVVAEE